MANLAGETISDSAVLRLECFQPLDLKIQKKKKRKSLNVVKIVKAPRPLPNSKCPFEKCHLNCSSVYAHRARYAFIKYCIEPTMGQAVEEGASTKIDYQKLALVTLQQKIDQEKLE